MLLHNELSDIIIACFYDVYNELGYGFLESVYENALIFELEERGFTIEKQKKIEVFYHQERVGHFFADICVEDKVILELKATPLKIEHELQLFNYLKATKIEVGYLLSFGQNPTFKRKYFSNKKKRIGHD